MPLYDPETGAFNDVAYALDGTAALNNDPSLFESVGNLVTKALPLTGLSIINSFANTAISFGNWLGADIKPWSVQDELGTTGTGGEYNDYYQQHSQGIEAAGLIAGSFIPGLAAVKALKLAQAGSAGGLLARATGVFSGARDAAIADGVAQLNAGEAALFPSLGASKFKAIAAGFGDQALQGVVWETATAATMKQSPLLSQDDFKDTMYNIFMGGLTGGVVGGTIEGIITRSVFKNALNDAALATNKYEDITRLGGLDSTYPAGDRAALLVKSMYDLPSPAGKGLQATQRYNAAVASAELDAKKLLTSFVGEDDHDLAIGTYEALKSLKEDGQLSPDDMYNYLMRLSDIKRLGATPSVPTGDTFWINRFTPKVFPQVQFSDIISDTKHELAFTSKRYEIVQNGYTPQVAHEFETITTPGGNTYPKYNNATEAFQQNKDIFINKRGAVFVNPDAPNLKELPLEGANRTLTIKEQNALAAAGKLPEGSEPYTGAPIILNLFTKDISATALPTIGDIGKPALLKNGISAGDTFIPQSLDTPLTAATPSLDANSRYVWANLRRVQPGDTIAANDIPMLEQLWREGQSYIANTPPGAETRDFAGYAAFKTKQGVTLGGDSIPTNSADLLAQIQEAKDDLIRQLQIPDPVHVKLSSTEIAQRANVPESYLETMGKAKVPEDFMVPPEQSAAINHAQLEYDLNNTMKMQDGNVARGMIDTQYRISLIQQAAQDVSTNLFKDKIDQFTINRGAQQADLTGAGANFLGGANSNYGSFQQPFERTGRAVTNWIKDRMTTIADQLARPVQALRADPAAMQELNSFIFLRRSTGENFTFMPEDIAKRYGMPANTVVLTKALQRDAGGNFVDWDKNYTPKNFLAAADKIYSPIGIKPDGQFHTFYYLSDKVAEFERVNQSINDWRNGHTNNFYTANGLQPKLEAGILYAPPINTESYPFFAMVRQREGQAFGDNSVSIITAKSEAELQQKIGSLREDYDVFTKGDNAEYRQVLGDYDYQRNFMQNSVNSDLRRRGILNNVVPDVGPDGTIRDYLNFHNKQETRLTRDFVELNNAQLFAEVRALGNRHVSTATSKFAQVISAFGRTAANPYTDTVKSALAISNSESYRLWADANEKVEAYASTAFAKAKDAFISASRNLIPYQEASTIAAKFGLGPVYERMVNASKAYEEVAYKLPPERYLTKFVSMANSVLSATAIRLDPFQTIINAASTPVLLLAEAHSASKAVQNLLTTELPNGTGKTIPAVTKLMYQAVTSFVTRDDDRQVLMPLLKSMGILKDDPKDYFRLVDSMTLPLGKLSDNQWIKKMDDMVELGSKYTGNQIENTFSHYVSAYMGWKIFQAAGHEGQDLADNVATFVNRVKGNYVASQRPIAFQGPIGNAIGLFQTYQFNLMQQMLRYVENGEGKTLALLAGVQSTMFGLSGLPGFQILNNSIVGNGATNPAHKDFFSTVASLMDPKLGNYIMYGALSNWLNTGLYSRGDINPRQLTLLPINPLDYPAIRGGIAFLDSMWNVTKNLVNGGNIPTSILLGLEHNGLSRPLSGLAQLMQGYVTTGDGGIVSTTRPGMLDNTAGYSDLFSAANFSRLMGARPLDEAIVLDAQYRNTMYKAKDQTRIQQIGEALKTNIYGGQPLETGKASRFLAEYTMAGGNITSFSQSMMKWTMDANVSVANKVYRELLTPNNQQLIQAMGGVRLQDFTTSAFQGNQRVPIRPPITYNTAPASTQVAPVQ